MGWAGDRIRRTWLLGLGVGRLEPGDGRHRAAPGATASCVLARSLLGVGEATYGVIAPTILMDLFPRQRRARVLSAFYLAMPIGERAWGWPWAAAHRREHWRLAHGFFVVGAPGLLAAFAALSCPSRSGGPARGSTPSGSRRTSRPGRAAADYLDLMVNSSYTYAVFGMAAYTFAIGGLASGCPTFLIVHPGHRRSDPGRARPARRDHAPLAAIVGHDASAAGWPTAWRGRSPRALFLVPGAGDARVGPVRPGWPCFAGPAPLDLRRRSSWPRP